MRRRFRSRPSDMHSLVQHHLNLSLERRLDGGHSDLSIALHRVSIAGDGHAVQGDGEVGMSAVETSLKGEIQVVLHKGMHITWPRAETPTHYMTMGLHEDLNQAAKIATREMLNFIVETKGLPRDDVFMLLSAAMDLRVTQIVDGTKGVHALMPKAVFHK